jgi:hypothetical protein
MEHIHPVYPALHLCDLNIWIGNFIKRHGTIDKQQHSEAGSEEPRKLELQDAVVLLVFALGEAVAFTKGTCERVTATRDQFIAFESAYYEEAVQAINEDGTDIDHAQKLLFAGHYNLLVGSSEDSVKFFKRADTVLRSLLDKHNLLFREEVTGLLTKNRIDVNSDVESSLKLFGQQHVDNEKKMTEMPQRLIVMAAWTCLRILRNSFPTEHERMTDLWKIEGLMPTLSKFPGKIVWGVSSPYRTKDGRTDDNEAISHFYQALTSIERLLETIRTGPHRKDGRVLSGQAIRNSLERCREDVDKWKAILPDDLRWNEQSALPSNPLQARLEEMYRQTMCEIDGCLPKRNRTDVIPVWRNTSGRRDSTCVSQRAGDVPTNSRTSSACRTDDSTYAPPNFAQKMFQVKEGSHTVDHYPHCSIHNNSSISTKTDDPTFPSSLLAEAPCFTMGACGSTANNSHRVEINSLRVIQEGHNRTSTSSLIVDLENMEPWRSLG